MSIKNMPPIELSHDIYENFHDIESIWRALEKDADIEIFQTFDWCQAWSSNYISSNLPSLKIVVLKFGEVPVCVFPLNLKRRKIALVLEFIGDPFNDYNAPIIDLKKISRHEVVKYFINHILPSIKYDLLLLTKQNGWVLEKDYSYFSRIQAQNLGHALVIKGEWSDYYTSRFNKKARYNHKRSLRLLEEEGVVCFQDEKLIGLEGALYRLLKFKSEFYNRAQVKDLFSTEEDIVKHIKFISELHSKNYIDVKCLILDGKIIAGHYGYIFRDIFYYIMPSYDYAYNKYSPGGLLLIKLIRQAFRGGKARFDFTIGGERYKKSWSNKENELFTYVKFSTIFGVFFYLYYIFRIKMSQISILRSIYKGL